MHLYVYLFLPQSNYLDFFFTHSLHLSRLSGGAKKWGKWWNKSLWWITGIPIISIISIIAEIAEETRSIKRIKETEAIITCRYYECVL